MIDKIKTAGWTSKYATEKEKAYISNNAMVVEVYWRGDRAKPESMAVIIANKEYLWYNIIITLPNKGIYARISDII